MIIGLNHSSLYCVHLLEWASRVKSQRILRRLERAYDREHSTACAPQPNIHARPW